MTNIIVHQIHEQYNKPIEFYYQFLCENDTLNSIVNKEYEDSSLSSLLDEIMNKYESNFNLVFKLNDLFPNSDTEYLKTLSGLLTPEEFRNYVNSLEIRSNQIIRLDPDRNMMSYYVFETTNSELMCYKTIGEYGTYLPIQYMKCYDIFKDSNDYMIHDIYGVYVPSDHTIHIYDVNSQSFVLYDFTDDDGVYVDFVSDNQDKHIIVIDKKYIVRGTTDL